MSTVSMLKYFFYLVFKQVTVNQESVSNPDPEMLPPGFIASDYEVSPDDINPETAIGIIECDKFRFN